MESASTKSIGKYQIYRTLGAGASCKVKLAKNLETGQKCAVKIFLPELEQEAVDLLMNEAKTMATLDHPNVVKQYEAGEDQYIKPSGQEKRIFIALEFLGGGELFDFIELAAFSEEEARYYFL